MQIFKRGLISIFLLFLVVFPVLAQQPDFDLTAKSAILMETETGDILYEKNSHLELPPASMTKIMTMLLVLEAVEDGRVSLDDKLVVSEYAASMGGSQVYLEPGEEMNLGELMKAIAISSANDASVAVAEYIYGTEDEFVRMMNKKASELNLKNTYFYNTNGLPPDDKDTQGNYTSTYDLAVMSKQLLKYQQVLEWTSTWIDYLRDGEFVLNNTNWLIRHYQGADGLKTGYTEEAKYCVTSTAERNGLRFIAVVMGVPESKQRFKEASNLLSYGFNIYKNMVVAQEGEILEEITINNAKNQLANLICPAEISLPVKKGEDNNISKEVVVNKDLKAPLKKGDTAGSIKIYKGNLLLKENRLVIDRDVEKASIFQMIYRMLKNIFLSLVGIFS